MHDSFITINKLKFSYDNYEVLSINHLSIAKGLTTVFLGANGSGKTTILKILSGLIIPSIGSIDRETINSRKNVIMVHQNPYLFLGTVRYNISFCLKTKKIPINKHNAIIHRVLKEAGLIHLIHRKTSQLSGGEKHRLAIARAIAVEPEILILDEPFAHIDIESREIIKQLINKRVQSGRTTVLSTHDLTSGYKLADSIVYLENGKIKKPENNFFKGSVKQRNDYFSSFVIRHGKQEVTIVAPVSNENHGAIVIPYSAIFLSRDKIKTSAQNQLSGEITSLEKINSQYFVTIDCGIEIKAVVTNFSVEELNMEKKEKVFVNFKATSVKLY